MKVVGTALATLVLAAALNVVVNPRAEFPVQAVPPVVATTHVEKWWRFEAAAPDTVILGSSSAMAIPAASLGDRAFNLAFPNADADEMLAMLQAMAAQGRLPAHLLVAVDARMVVAEHSPRFTAVAGRLQFEPTWDGALDRAAATVLDADYLRDSVRALGRAARSAVTGEPVAVGAFPFDARGDVPEGFVFPGGDGSGNASLARVEAHAAEYAGATVHPEAVRPLLDWLASRNGTVVLTPVHPALPALASRLGGDYAAAHDALWREVVARCGGTGRGGLRATDAAVLGLPASDFQDGLHTSRAAGARVGALAASAPGCAGS